MRVLYVIDFYWPATEWGGPTTCVKSLAEALVQSGAEVTVLTTTARGSSGLAPLARGTREVNGVSVVYAGCVGPRRLILSPELADQALVLGRKHDIVHAHGLWGFGVMAASGVCGLLRVPYLLTLHGILDAWSLQQKETKKRLHLRLVGDRILGRAARIHYTMEAERSAAPAKYRGLPSVVVSNSVDVARFRDVPAEAANTDQIELLMLGRIHPKNGFEIALPAMRQLVDEGVSVRLTVAGHDEDGYRRKVERLAAGLGLSAQIRFVGMVNPDDLPRLFAEIHVVMMPSYQENFGMSVAEAMAAGRAVVVSDRVNMWPDVERAEAGFVVSLSPEALAGALRKLADSRAMRTRMGANGRRLAEHEYAPEVVAKRMLDVYEAVLGGRHRGKLDGAGIGAPKA